MEFILFLVLFIGLVSLLRQYLKDNFFGKKQFDKINMIKWMKMSPEKRRVHDREQMLNTMNRKRNLLKNIRKEYKKIGN
tara:strand:+ start:639 stop:875 length:237 start_codon:yes stop_codon:yes gene_type:complete